MSPFTRTLCIGAGAAASLPLFSLFLGPLLGPGHALAVHAVSWTVAWLVWLARGARQRLAVGAAVAAAGLAAWAVAPSVGALVLALGGIAAAVRSGWLYRRTGLRALVAESAVLAGACLTASFLFAGGLASAALAAWGWFAVQSFYFLLGGVERRRPRPSGDAFEEAARRLESLLDAPL